MCRAVGGGSFRGGFDLVPGHACEDQCHAAGVGDTGEHQAGPDEGGESGEAGMYQHCEYAACEGHEARADADLAFEGNRTATADDRQAGLIPCKCSAIDIDDMLAAGSLKFFAGLSPAAAGAADDVEWFGAWVLCEHVTGVEGFEWEIAGGGSVDFLEFSRCSDIDQLDIASVFDVVVQFFGGNRSDGHGLNFRWSSRKVVRKRWVSGVFVAGT